jgi:hypothetical protein
MSNELSSNELVLGCGPAARATREQELSGPPMSNELSSNEQGNKGARAQRATPEELERLR